MRARTINMSQTSGKGVEQLQLRMENYSKEWLESQNLQIRHYLLAVKGRGIGPKSEHQRTLSTAK